MRLYIVRHGDPDYERDDLTEEGLREAASPGEFSLATDWKRSTARRLDARCARRAIRRRATGLPLVVEDWARGARSFVTTPVPHGVGLRPGTFRRPRERGAGPRPGRKGLEWIFRLSITRTEAVSGRTRVGADDFPGAPGLLSRENDLPHELRKQKAHRLILP